MHEIGKYKGKKVWSVSHKILASTLIISSFFTFFVVGIQIYLGYKEDLSDLDARFGLIESTYIETLSHNVWSFSSTQINIALKGILSLPDISYLEILDTSGQVTHTAGAMPDGRKKTKQIDLYVLENGVREPLGKLTVVAGLNKIESRTFHKIFVVLLTQAVKTFLVSSAILMLINFILTRHLNVMRIFFEKYDPGDASNQKLRFPGKKVLSASDSVDDIDILGDSINQMIVKLDDFHVNLDQKIKERTSELNKKTEEVKSILQNIKQGIFTFGENNRIEKEYSAHVEQIFMRSDITGLTYQDILFRESNIGQDERHKIDSSIMSIFGEEFEFFHTNSHHLPKEIQFTLQQTDKVIEVDWEPICSFDGLVERIMVVTRDVTEVRSLQKETSDQKNKLKMIQELLKMNLMRFNKFTKSARSLVEHNRNIINSYDASQENIELLFRNMHTLKGITRLYGLSFAIDAIHTAEEYYADLRASKVEWNPLKMQVELDEVEHSIMRYEHLLLEVVGSLKAENDPKAELVELVEEFISSSSMHTSDFIAKVLNVKSRHQWRTLKDILTDEVASIVDLASILRKPVPTVEFSGDLLFRNDAESLLKNVMTHCFRNSLDHGLEDARRRKEKGKEAQGKILLHTKMNGSLAEIHFEDDGQGLDLASLAEKGCAARLLVSGNDDMEIASLIFHSGISTAEELTEISGRGVGMNAVKYYLEEAGGAIKVVFVEDRGVEQRYRKFKFVISLPGDFARVTSHA